MTALDGSAPSPSFLGKHLVQGILLLLELWVIGVLAPDKWSVRTKFWGYVSMGEGRGGNAEYRALQSRCLRASQVKSDTGPRHRGGKGRPRKGEDHPRWGGGRHNKEGAYLGDVSWALQAEGLSTRARRAPEVTGRPSLGAVLRRPPDALGPRAAPREMRRRWGEWPRGTFRGRGGEGPPAARGAVRVSRRSHPLRDLLRPAPGR